jgi:hypothetical protein
MTDVDIVPTVVYIASDECDIACIHVDATAI